MTVHVNYRLVAATLVAFVVAATSPAALAQSGATLVAATSDGTALNVTRSCFQTSKDRQQLRVTTTALSDTAPMPLTVNRFFWRIQKRPRKFECIETLSMNRVCSTGRLAL